MKIQVKKAALSEILPLRELFLQENNFQIRYDACHVRNWSDSYMIHCNGMPVGYGSVKGKEELKHRDAIFEFYLLPTFRSKSSLFFKQLIKTTEATYIECQSNDLILAPMLYEFSNQIESDTILFGESFTSNLALSGFHFRPTLAGDNVFGKKASDKGAYALEKEGEIVADGGFLLHYNIPFADLYMEVSPSHRGKGYASIILQEMKKECYLAGRVPAARCNIKNPGSKGSLLKAGMQVLGYMLVGKIK